MPRFTEKKTRKCKIKFFCMTFFLYFFLILKIGKSLVIKILFYKYRKGKYVKEITLLFVNFQKFSTLLDFLNFDF